MISILTEGIIVFLNKKECPLGIIHKRYGDDKTFFELILPKKLAEEVIPALGSIAIFGVIIYFIERIV